MWTSYGRRDGSLAAPVAERAFVSLSRAECWYGPAAIAVLFAYPNPLVPVALGALTLSLGARLARGQRLASATPLDAGFSLFLLGALLGLGVAENLEAALLRFTGMLAATALFYLSLDWLRSERALRRGALLLLASVVVASLVVLSLLRGQLPDSTVARLIGPALRVFGGFAGVSGDTLDVNARFAVHQYGLAHLLLIGLAFATSALALGTGRRLRVGGLLSLALLTPLLLATQARGAVVALAVAASVVAGLRTRWAWAILPLAGAAFYGLLARGTISRSIEAEWLSQRLSYWSRTLGLLGDFPLSGSGLGIRTFAEVFAWYHGLPDPYAVSHTHNIFLQAYAEQGLFGLVGLFAIFVAGVGLGLGCVRRCVGSTRWIIGGATGGVLASAVYGLTDQVPSTNLSLGLVFGLLALVVGGSKSTPPAAAGTDLNPQPPSLKGRGERLNKRPLPFREGGQGVRSLLAGVGGVGVFLALVLVLGAVALAPRWVSGALLNIGSADLVAAALDRSRDVEARRARLARAEWELAQAARWNPTNVAAFRNLGWARLLQHEVVEAHAAIEAAYRPDLTAFERAQLARLARESGLTELAVTLLREGGDEAGLRELAGQLWTARRWHDAAVTYAALTELNPDEAEYVSNTAIAVLNGGGDVQEAMGLLRQAVVRNPGAARNLARQLVLRGEPCRNDERRGGGRFDCAAFWFGLASRVDPSYDRPEVELGSILYYRGLYEEAASHFAEAARRDPRNPSTYNQLGDTYLKLARPDEAVRFYEQGVQARPERPELHVNLARAYLLVGRRDDALREYRAAVELAPGNRSIRDELERATKNEE